MPRKAKPRKKREPPQPLSVIADELSEDLLFNQVMAWLTEGKAEPAIREGLACVPAERVERIMVRAVAHYQAVGTIQEEGLRTTFGWCLEATKECYRELMDCADYVNALKAVKQIRDLAMGAAMLPPAAGRQDGSEGEDDGHGRIEDQSEA